MLSALFHEVKTSCDININQKARNETNFSKNCLLEVRIYAQDFTLYKYISLMLSLIITNYDNIYNRCRRGKTAILTSSPYNAELEMLMTPKKINPKTVGKTAETKNVWTV